MLHCHKRKALLHQQMHIFFLNGDKILGCRLVKDIIIPTLEGLWFRFSSWVTLFFNSHWIKLDGQTGLELRINYAFFILRRTIPSKKKLNILCIYKHLYHISALRSVLASSRSSSIRPVTLLLSMNSHKNLAYIG